MRRMIGMQLLRDDADERRRCHHADLHRARRDVFKDSVELRREELRRRLLNGPDTRRVLRRQRRHGAHTENAMREKRLEIRLNPRPAARIAARDGEDGDDFFFHEMPSYKKRAIPTK